MGVALSGSPVQRRIGTVQLDLAAIADTLCELQGALPSLGERLGQPHSELDDAAVMRLLSGYRFICRCAPDARWLQGGHSLRLLELNHRVLFGTSGSLRHTHRRALAHTENRFYDERVSGIGPLVEWYRMNRRLSPWNLAAGIYIRVLGTPQLFVEGNHRTAALIMSRILLEAHLPPFVLSASLAPEWLARSADILALKRRGLRALMQTQPLRRELAALLEAHSDTHYLKRQSGQST